jgi:hypothetical protein
MTNEFGPLFTGRAAYHQRPVPTQVLHGLSNAFFRMPIADPGKLAQLGGEFIIAPGNECEFAHRMTTTSDHMEAPDVLRLTGMESPTKSDLEGVRMAEAQRLELDRLQREMKTWKIQREAELDRYVLICVMSQNTDITSIRRQKAARRGEAYVPPEYNPSMSLIGLDAGLDVNHLNRRRSSGLPNVEAYAAGSEFEHAEGDDLEELDSDDEAHAEDVQCGEAESDPDQIMVEGAEVRKGIAIGNEEIAARYKAIMGGNGVTDKKELETEEDAVVGITTARAVAAGGGIEKGPVVVQTGSV